jgi:hypothetical protein
VNPATEGKGAAGEKANGVAGPGQDAENPPQPFAWVEAMRSVGYSPPTALAELVDNSITAGARNITIRMSLPRSPAIGGYITVEDDGRGMAPAQLAEAMRWGESSPGRQRQPNDLGRFGLGMKTASVSMGRSLTVASRGAPGEGLRVLRWDLDHIAKVGWRMLDGPDAEAEGLLARSALAADGGSTGTVVIVTQLDRLAGWASPATDAEQCEAALAERISRHLGMVFHRFIADGLSIKLGGAAIPARDPFDGGVQKAAETLSDGAGVASFVLPHRSGESAEQTERMAGPLGWGAHQGFLVYRARRLIIPGGWLRLFAAGDGCRLARIRIDLPNSLDGEWSLDVLKAGVVPPPRQLADLRRIGEAARGQALAELNSQGDRQAPDAAGHEEPVGRPLWSHAPAPDAVLFRINRAHPIVQTLKRSVRDPAAAEDFLRAFERPLPKESKLRAPKLTLPPFLKDQTFLFFGAVAIMVYLRLLYRASYFPPYYEGEEANALDLAKATCEYAAYTNSWLQCVIGGFFEYNKGYHWALVPLYSIFGYDVRLITYALPVFFSVFCAAFCTIYRKVYPKSSLLSFVLVAVFSVLCVCLRRYKWHSMTYLSAISVYLYFLPYFQNCASYLNDKRLKVLSLSLFAVSCYCYFGCLIYAVPFLLLAFYFSTRAQRRVELKYAWIGALAFLAVFAATYRITDLWGLRIRETLEHVVRAFSRDGLQEKWWSVRDFFFTMYLSPPYLILFVVGLVASFRRIWRGDRFALVTMTLLLWLWAFQLSTDVLNNADQLNWSMIPILGVLLIGSDQILAAIRDKVGSRSIICAVLVVLVVWNELSAYPTLNRDVPYQPYVQPHNVRTQAALVLMMIRDDDSGSVQYYLPDPSVPDASGGFDYNVSLKRVDFGNALSRVVFFTSEDDFQKKLAAQPRDKWAVVYLSVGEPPPIKDAKDNSDVPFVGQKPQIIHPFESIYKIPFIVREYRMRPGPANAQAAGGSS